MSEKLVIKYLSPSTGQYEFATVQDVGDLEKLNTNVKTDLVSAINEILLRGTGNGGGGNGGGNGQGGGGGTQPVNPDIQKAIDNINNELKKLRESSLSKKQMEEVNKAFNDNITEIVNNLNKKFDESKKANDESIKTKIAELSNVIDRHISDNNANIGSLNSSVENVKRDLERAKSDIGNFETEKEKTSLAIDELKASVALKAEKQTLDLMNQAVQKLNSQVDLNTEGLKATVSKNELSLVTDRLTNSESRIEIAEGKINTAVSKKELLTEIAKAKGVGSNLLKGTRDLSGWTKDGAVSETSDYYREAKVFTLPTGNSVISFNMDDLEVGKSYTASIYAKVLNNDPLVNITFTHGSETLPMSRTTEDTTILNEWKRVAVSFVAQAEKERVSFRYNGLTSSNTGYIAGPKIESGPLATAWQPSVSDQLEVIRDLSTKVNQTASDYTVLQTSMESMGNRVTQTEQSLQANSDGIKLQAQKVTKVEEDIKTVRSELKVEADSVTQKVTQALTNKLESTNIELNNRVINGNAFAPLNKGWRQMSENVTRTTVDGQNYIVLNGTTALSSAITSNAFYTKDGEKLRIGFDIMSGKVLTDEIVATLEIYDISDSRIMRKEFMFNELQTLYGDSKYVDYTISNPNAKKASIRLVSNQNGLKFTNVYVRGAGISGLGYTPASQDTSLITGEVEAGIRNTADQVSLYANKIQQLGEKVDKQTAEFNVRAGQIEAKIIDKDNVVQTINAAPEGLTIDFKKVKFTSEVLAPFMDISKGLAVRNGQNVVLGADSDGNILMNVSKLTINGKSYADKLSDMETDFAKKIKASEDKIKPDIDKISDSLQDVSKKTIDLEKNANKEMSSLRSSMDSLIAEYSLRFADANADRIKLRQELEQAILTETGRALQRVAVIENNLGNFVERWNFLDRQISLSNEGLVIGNKATNTYVLLNDKAIAFINNGQPVASIAGGVLKINQAIFIKEIQIGEFLISEYKKNHLTFRYIGS